MDKLGDIVSQAIGHVAEERTYDEKTIDKVKAWHQVLEGVYNIRPLPPAGVIAWVSVLQECKQGIMDAVIRDWVRENSTAPKPADLLREYRYITAANRQQQKSDAQRNMRFDADGEPLYNCPYCRDTGFFLQYYGQNADDSYHSRAYQCSCDQRSGILSEALNDGRWEFDFSAWGFVRRKSWVGG